MRSGPGRREINLRAAGIAIILMVAETRNGKVCGGAQAGAGEARVEKARG